MSVKQKFSKQNRTAKDREDNRKFLIVIAIVTIALMTVMYFVFAR